MKVLYTCYGCGTIKRELEVPPRGAEDVVTWTQQTMEHVGVDHRQQSPGCPSQHADLLVPVAGAERIGEDPVV